MVFGKLLGGKQRVGPGAAKLVGGLWLRRRASVTDLRARMPPCMHARMYVSYARV